MDDLTARALQNQSNANANYYSKLQREEERKKLTEAPAFVTGFEGGKYQIERLGQDPVATGVPVTNGLLEVGRRATTTGQYVDGMPRVKPVAQTAPVPSPSAGIIMWLDCNWLFQTSPEVKANGFKLLEAMIEHFKAKKIYTLPTDDDRIFVEGSAVYSLDDPVIAGLLDEKNITVIRTPIAQAQGLFFMPLLGQANRAGLTIPTPTEAEFSALRRLAKRYGVLICGEYLAWLPYDRAILRGLKLPSRITIAGDTLDQNDYRVVGKGFPELTLTGNAQGFFGGLNPSEKLVINQQENTVFAFFKKI